MAAGGDSVEPPFTDSLRYRPLVIIWTAANGLGQTTSEMC